jgi:hypothetical protein
MRYVDDPPIEDHQHRGYFVENVGSPHVATGTLGLNLRALSGRRASNVAARGARTGFPSALLLLTRRCAPN